MNADEVQTLTNHLREIKSALTNLRSRLSSITQMDIDVTWEDDFVTDFNPEQQLETVESMASDVDDVLQQLEDMGDDDDMNDDDDWLDDEDDEDADEDEDWDDDEDEGEGDDE